MSGWASHTPGPWHYARNRDIVADCGCIAELWSGPCGILQADANAKLIAAAPDLLAALKVVVADWTAQFERAGHLAPAWCKQARAAIAKAEGLMS